MVKERSMAPFTPFTVKISGTKVTIKRPVPVSPANVRRVTPGTPQNPRHVHIPVPRSIAKKIIGGGG